MKPARPMLYAKREIPLTSGKLFCLVRRGLPGPRAGGPEWCERSELDARVFGRRKLGIYLVLVVICHMREPGKFNRVPEC